MKAFFNTKSIVGRVLIVSLLAGGLVFAGTLAVNMFVPTPTEASNCCGVTESELAKDGTSNKLEGCCGSTKGPLTVTSDPCKCLGNSTCSTSTCSSSGSCNGANGCHPDCNCHSDPNHAGCTSSCENEEEYRCQNDC